MCVISYITKMSEKGISSGFHRIIVRIIIFTFIFRYSISPIPVLFMLTSDSLVQCYQLSAISANNPKHCDDEAEKRATGEKKS